MTTFNERESAYEAQFAHQEELRFKARERAVRLLGLWAAKRLGKSAEASEAYARDIVADDVADPGSEAAFERIMNDLRSGGVSEQEVRQASDRFGVQARQSTK